MSRLVLVVSLICGAAFAMGAGPSRIKDPVVLQPAEKPCNGPFCVIPYPSNVAPLTPTVPTSPSLAVVLYDFWGPSCSHCRNMKPTIEALKSTGALVREIDTSTREGGDLASKMNVHGLPTYVAMQGDKELGRQQGECSLVDLQVMMERIPKSKNGTYVHGGNGWHLRLLYPQDSEVAAEWIERFKESGDLHEFGETYGFRSIATSDPLFSYWYDAGYKHVDRAVVLLIDSKDRIVMKEFAKDLGTDSGKILDRLQSAVGKRPRVVSYASHEMESVQ